MESNSYSAVTQAIVDELRRIVGDKYVVFGDTEKLEPYSHDEIPDRAYAHMPDCLVRPRTAEEIAAIMKLANRERIPVTPRGAGSGLSGGAVPLYGGIVLACDRMNRILEIDTREHGGRGRAGRGHQRDQRGGEGATACSSPAIR